MNYPATEYFAPYDADRPLMLKCSCGADHTEAEHRQEQLKGLRRPALP